MFNQINLAQQNNFMQPQFSSQQPQPMISNSVGNYMGGFAQPQAQPVINNTINNYMGGFIQPQPQPVINNTINNYVGGYAQPQAQPMIANSINNYVGGYAQPQAQPMVNNSINNFMGGFQQPQYQPTITNTIGNFLGYGQPQAQAQPMITNTIGNYIGGYAQPQQNFDFMGMFQMIMSQFGNFIGTENSNWANNVNTGNNALVSNTITNTQGNGITNIINNVIWGGTNFEENEEVIIVGAYNTLKDSTNDKGRNLTLEDNIKDFYNSGTEIRATNGGTNPYYQGADFHNNVKSNDTELKTLLSKMSNEDKNLSFDNGEAYVISKETGEVIATLSSGQIAEQESFFGKMYLPTADENEDFEIVEDLGLRKETTWNDISQKGSEEATGGVISINGKEYDVSTTVVRKATPLILDQNGDGIKLTSVENGVNFDLNADGEENQTAWTDSADDAFLVLDKNNDGQVNSGAELFGDQNGAENGFLELAKYDSNNDGKIDANDDIFSELKVWSDENKNGKVDAGEFKSLLEANISSISTSYKVELGENGEIKEDEHGNTVGLVGSFENTNGEILSLIDALLQYI